jgi:hypothetical protein
MENYFEASWWDGLEISPWHYTRTVRMASILEEHVSYMEENGDILLV